ncbi:hypothetical protein WMY93_019761 [Mugilogobius chulae]|uniref:Extracellular matrix protein 1 n=1 Tax=Mugilogobius chulae TaxID=88201 RepID=A0AAW0NI47_9GOBI
MWSLQQVEVVELQQVEVVELQQVEVVELQQVEVVELQQVEVVELQQVEVVELQQVEVVELQQVEVVELQQVEVVELLVSMLSNSTQKENCLKSQFEEPVPFPPAPPTPENIVALCYNGNSRHRYPADSIPSSWSSHFRRRAAAIDRLENWYHFCCNASVTGTVLCCAQQAWVQALSQFCVEEYSTMTGPYDCCRHQGSARWMCFSTEPFNPSYSPTLDYIAQFTPHVEALETEPGRFSHRFDRSQRRSA